MGVRLAVLTYSRDAHIWRLRLDSPDGIPEKLIELPGFSGDITRPDDLEKINAALASWGVYPTMGGWQARDGGWVVPVVERSS